MQATALPVVAATPSVPAPGHVPGHVTYAAQVSDVIVASPTTVVAQMAQASSTTTAQVQEAHSTTNHTLTPSQDGDAAMERDKRAIYRHPLFPLMALLFEKCEQASQTPDCPSSDSFDVDIQSFVHHQEQDGKPFFSEDPELDSLSVLEWKLANEDPDTTAIMVKAIQVLRIHLLELEKVSDLCKDFCNRYTSCLKGKLQSENLLRCDISGDSDDLDPTSPTTPLSSPGINGNNMFQPLPPQQQQQQQPAPNNMTLTNQGQIVSGGTVYQMVQTPQGLVAQPIQIQQPNQPSATPPVIHGSTPLSQIGVTAQSPQHNNNNNTPSVISPAMMLDDDDDDPKRKSKRGVLPKQATQIMKSWLFQHIVHPYPTEDEKRQIAGQTNLTLLQVNNWFINARRRILQPMLDASNPSEAKAKKNKPNSQQRPVQRFWPESIANLQQRSEEGSEDGADKLNETADSQSDRQSESSTPCSTPAVDTSSSQQTTQQNLVLPAGAIITSEGAIQLPDGTTVHATSPRVHIVQNGEKGVEQEEKATSSSDVINTSHGVVEASDSSSLVD